MMSYSSSSTIVKAVLVLVGSITLSSIALCQANSSPTEAEKKVARTLSAQFETKLDDAGSIEPVAKEMFPPDFVRLLVDAERRRMKLGGFSNSENVLFVSGLEYNPKLIDEATEDDWRQFYIATFDIFQYPSTRMMNRMVGAILEAKSKGKNPEDVEDSFTDIKPSDLFPRDVIGLFDKHPILNNFVIKKGSNRSISTVSELRSVTATLQQALVLLQKSKLNDARLSPNARKFIQHFTDENEKEIGPWLSITDDEFSLPKGTRIITIFSAPQHELTIVQIGSEYKIIRARISSPD